MTLLKNGFKQDFERLFQVHPIKFKNKKKALLNLFKIGQKGVEDLFPIKFNKECKLIVNKLSFFLTNFHLVRKVKDVNEDDRLSNITLRNKLKYRIKGCK